MEFDFNESLEALKKLVNDVANTAKKATRSAATVTKAEVNIFSEQDKLRKAYLALGKLYYRDYITGEEPDDAEYIPLCDAITAATKNINDLKIKVSEVTSSKKDDCEQTEEAAEEEPFDAEEELNNLNEQLDDLSDNLKDLNDEKDAAVEAVFEVVEDTPVEEPKPEEEKPAE